MRRKPMVFSPTRSGTAVSRNPAKQVTDRASPFVWAASSYWVETGARTPCCGARAKRKTDFHAAVHGGRGASPCPGLRVSGSPVAPHPPLVFFENVRAREALLHEITFIGLHALREEFSSGRPPGTGSKRSRTLLISSWRRNGFWRK